MSQLGGGIGTEGGSDPLLAERQKRRLDAAARAAYEQRRREAVRRPETALGLVGVDALAIDVGADLYPLLVPPNCEALLDRVADVRRALAAETGIVIPGVRLRDDPLRDPRTYALPRVPRRPPRSPRDPRARRLATPVSARSAQQSASSGTRRRRCRRARTATHRDSAAERASAIRPRARTSRRAVYGPAQHDVTPERRRTAPSAPATRFAPGYLRQVRRRAHGTGYTPEMPRETDGAHRQTGPGGVVWRQ